MSIGHPHATQPRRPKGACNEHNHKPYPSRNRQIAMKPQTERRSLNLALVLVAAANRHRQNTAGPKSASSIPCNLDGVAVFSFRIRLDYVKTISTTHSFHFSLLQGSPQNKKHTSNKNELIWEQTQTLVYNTWTRKQRF